jgi:hypothetical protein
VGDAEVIAPTIPVVENVGGDRRLRLVHADGVGRSANPGRTIKGDVIAGRQVREYAIYETVQTGIPGVGAGD